MEKDIPSFLKPGLYLVATPIGNLGDITLRALETLKSSDIIACEDTRVSQKLLSYYNIQRPLWPYHDHNAEKIRPQLLRLLAQKKVISLISDAGMPLISDPGYKLVKACQSEGHYVSVIPGASAVLSALVLSGQPSHPFLFGGFVEVNKLANFQALPVTLIFFEAPQRLVATLQTMSRLFSNRSVSVVRELTKLFEEVIAGSFEEVLSILQDRDRVRGEIVIVLGPPAFVPPTDALLQTLLQEKMATSSLKDAVNQVATITQVARNHVYELAIDLKNAQKKI